MKAHHFPSIFSTVLTKTSLLLGIVLLCHFSAKAQYPESTLKDAFSNNSLEVLDVFINENNINKALPDKRIESK
ncbi:hypothetical protein [Albibacterium indicum]|uniref:hypothetical protein n=1 Tax=Albibacterium indicum TaxID=2292082 RepID=UPI000E488FEF|nr:hypothetical protein [Pedobacter indicus]